MRRVAVVVNRDNMVVLVNIKEEMCYQQMPGGFMQFIVVHTLLSQSVISFILSCDGVCLSVLENRVGWADGVL